MTIVQRISDRPTCEIRDAVLDQVNRFAARARRDDQTLLVARFRSAVGTGQLELTA